MTSRCPTVPGTRAVERAAIEIHAVGSCPAPMSARIAVLVWRGRLGQCSATRANSGSRCRFSASGAAPRAAPSQETPLFPAISGLSCRLIIPWSGVRIPPGLLSLTRCAATTSGDISRRRPELSRPPTRHFRCKAMQSDAEQCELYGTNIGTSRHHCRHLWVCDFAASRLPETSPEHVRLARFTNVW